MKQMYDAIVLGGGPAGYTAALYAVRAGLSVLVIEKMIPGGQMATADMIDNYPGFPDGIDGLTLGMQMQKGALRFGAVTAYESVTSVHLTGKIKTVTTDSGTYDAKTVIIATGAAPKKLGIDGEEALVGNGVHYCAHCDGRFYKDKIALVVGGGNSAVSDALYLSRLAKEVILVHRRDSLRASALYQKQLTAAQNIQIEWNSRVTAFLCGDTLEGVRLAHTQTGAEREVPANGVFVSIGRSPETELFIGQITMNEAGYILADESTKTNIPGVFAAGDVRVKPLRQIVTAVSDGAVAASMAEEYLLKLKM